MNGPGPYFELPRNIEHLLATLSKLYSQEGQRQKQEIIVNAQVRVHEEWSSNNWNGGTYGHALYLNVPENLYLSAVRQKDKLQKEIKSDLNGIHNIQNEFIEEVFLEMEVDGDQDWRWESGLVRPHEQYIQAETIKRIWGDRGFRVFFSHKAEVKREIAELKMRLRLFGVSGFVAHEDIHPTKEWQDEIEKALSSMDAFVALLTEGFHDSLWTDQEVGFAIGRGVPIIAVKLGKDPYGYIGKMQALSCAWPIADREIAKLLIKHPRMIDEYIGALYNCSCFDESNKLSEILPSIERITDEQVQQLVSVYNENDQIRGSFGFNGNKEYYHGVGLAAHLSRLTRRDYTVDSFGLIHVD